MYLLLSDCNIKIFVHLFTSLSLFPPFLSYFLLCDIIFFKEVKICKL
nr:MAG TPA: hypothetical protein [Caudoviricetes sp.]